MITIKQKCLLLYPCLSNSLDGVQCVDDLRSRPHLRLEGTKR